MLLDPVGTHRERNKKPAPIRSVWQKRLAGCRPRPHQRIDAREKGRQRRPLAARLKRAGVTDKCRLLGESLSIPRFSDNRPATVEE